MDHYLDPELDMDELRQEHHERLERRASTDEGDSQDVQALIREVRPDDDSRSGGA